MKDDLAVLSGELRGDDRTVEQHASEFERLLGRRIDDDDVDFAGIGLRRGARRQCGQQHKQRKLPPQRFVVAPCPNDYRERPLQAPEGAL